MSPTNTFGLALLLVALSGFSMPVSAYPAVTQDDDSSKLYVLTSDAQQADDVSRGFRTVFEPSTNQLVTPTRNDAEDVGNSPRPVNLGKRIAVNRRCIQDVNFSKRPWQDTGMQADREINYDNRDGNGCLQMVKFAPGSDTPVTDQDTLVLTQASKPRKTHGSTQVGIDLARRVKNTFIVSPATLAALLGQNDQ